MNKRLRFLYIKARKILLVLLLIIGLVCGVTSCKNGTFKKTNHSGFFVADWYGYSGITGDEEAVAQIPFISVCSGKDNNECVPSRSFNSDEVSVVIDGNSFTGPGIISWKKGNTIDRFTFYTLFLKLPKLKIGTHRITEIKIPIGTRELYYPIHWTVDVKNANEINSCVSVKGQSIVSGSLLTGIDFEVQNSCKSPQIIKTLYFKVPKYIFNVHLYVKKSEEGVSTNSGTSSNDRTPVPAYGLSTGNKIVISGFSKKWIHAELTLKDAKNTSDFVFLKPFVLCKVIGGKDFKLSEFYSPIVFSKFPQNKKEIEKLLMSDFINGKNTP